MISKREMGQMRKAKEKIVAAELDRYIAKFESAFNAKISDLVARSVKVGKIEVDLKWGPITFCGGLDEQRFLKAVARICKNGGWKYKGRERGSDGELKYKIFID